ncbi:MAG: hypothetical protein RIC57_09075 [Balneola sp.]
MKSRLVQIQAMLQATKFLLTVDVSVHLDVNAGMLDDQVSDKEKREILSHLREPLQQDVDQISDLEETLNDLHQKVMVQMLTTLKLHAASTGVPYEELLLDIKQEMGDHLFDE